MDGSQGLGAGRLAETGYSPVMERALITVGAVLVTVVLVALAALGPTLAGLASAAALYLALLAVLGRDRMAATTMVAVFFSAPFYRTLDPSATVTPTHVLLALAVLLFMPTVITRRLHLPAVYWGGTVLIVGAGVLASLPSAEPERSLINVVQWLIVLVGLPLIYVLWRPSPRMIRGLLWSYVAGHMVSLAWALIEGPLAHNRYDGLTHHANGFGEAGLMSVAILLYLFHEHRKPSTRIIVIVAALLSVQSVIMSGSRGAILVLAVLVLMIPVVERSAVGGFVLALLGGLLLAFLPFVLKLGGEGSALDRLGGGSGTAGADAKRSSVSEWGWQLFLENPLIGHGYLWELGKVHNLYLQVAASAGVFAVIGFVMVLYAFARPLFDRHPQRRLCYLPWAYGGLIIGVPSLVQLTSWVPMALAILVAVAASESSGRRYADVAEPEGVIARPG